MTFGKVMGGGFPAAAFGGRADVMSRLAPEGPVYQAGTLSGNPIATTAGLTTLRLATDEVYAHIGAAADTIKTAASDALSEAGVAHVVQATGTMFSVFFADGRRCATSTTRRAPTRRRTPRSSTRCSTHGVYLPPSAYEAWFLSAAHDDRAVQTVLDALPAPPAPRPPPGAAGDPEMSQTPDTDRPPAAPRRGAQPRGRPLRPPRRLPPLRPRPADGRAGRREHRRPRHRAPAGLAARARPGDRAAAGAGPRPRDRHRRAGDRVDQHLRGHELRRGRDDASSSGPRPGGTSGTRSGRRGASRTRRSWPG